MNISRELYEDLLESERELACARRAVGTFLASFKACPICQANDEEERVHTNTCILALIVNSGG